jgi:thymidylate synthase (FAD)
MKVSEIQVTAIHPERWGDDLDVVNAARVSFHKEADYARNWAGDKDGITERDEKLINYLAKHKHFSPFNHSFITMRVKAPVFVARQLVKHKFMPINEVSRRYVTEEPEFYFPDHWRGKPINTKQGSDGIVERDHLFLGGKEAYTEDGSVQYALNQYNWLLMRGVAPEQARMILPQNMMTECIWSGTLGAWCDMLVLRLDPHTQYESRIVAEKARDLIDPIFPVSLKARLDN